MELRPYLTAMTVAQREEFARRAGTTRGYLELLRCGARRPGPTTARAIYRASGGRVPLSSMRPDIWGSAA